MHDPNKDVDNSLKDILAKRNLRKGQEIKQEKKPDPLMEMIKKEQQMDLMGSNNFPVRLIKYGSRKRTFRETI